MTDEGLEFMFAWADVLIRIRDAQAAGVSLEMTPKDLTTLMVGLRGLHQRLSKSTD